MQPVFSDEPALSEEDGVRYLHFGSPWVQGAMQLRRPDYLMLEYTRQMMAWKLFAELNHKDLVANLGLGAGALVRHLLAHTPAVVETVERNPQVTAACELWFGLPDTDRCIVVHEDAADWVQRLDRQNRYRLLLVDLYDANAQGPVCDSPEFYQGCHDVLTEDGLMVVNLFGNHPSFERNLFTIKDAFADRAVVLPASRAGNRIVLAFRTSTLRGITTADVLERADRLAKQFGYPAHEWARSSLQQLRPGDSASDIG